jgi:hypothetical protein
MLRDDIGLPLTNPGLPPTTLAERHEAFPQDPIEAMTELS